MLAPKDRTLLLEALRPPPGFRLDAAVSTTYSLDLMALLVAPLAFTFFDWEDETGEPTRDPNALLEAVRRYADRMDVFCQAGQIAVPSAYRLLFSYLESSVHAVRAPREGGVFHPKVWVIRYVAQGEANRYRVLCASRNLTFDRCWDTLLVLDGAQTRKRSQKNEPLARFLMALPGMVVGGLSRRRKETVTALANEILQVEFELPEHIEEIAFWPLGIPAHHDIWPFPENADRALVIAPFASNDVLQRLKVVQDGTFISRIDTLGALSVDALQGYESYVLSDGADFDAEAEAETAALDASEDTFSGLHTKLFAFDSGGKGSVWTGSANATHAAFHRNVEFLVELRGESRHMGVEAILSPSQMGVSVLRDLLEPFTPVGEAEGDAVAQQLDRALWALKAFVVDLELGIQAVPAGEGVFDLVLAPRGTPVLPDGDVALTCWPLTLRQDSAAQALRMPQDSELRFGGISFEGLTRFFGFEGRVTIKGQTARTRFVLNLPADGFPDNRRQGLLRYMLKDRKQVLRYLLLLLADEGELAISELVGQGRQLAGAGNGAAFHADIPMLEALVRALESSPAKLDQVRQFVEELQSTEEGHKLLPEGFDAIWSPVWEAREALRRHGAQG
jgi:hypothetical protein